MNAIRMLHFADVHIGVANYGRIDSKTGMNSRVLDFLQRFDEMINYGLEREVDLVVFAGDAFQSRNPNPTYQRAFARRIKRLADSGAPVVLLAGNHDIPAMTQRASTLDVFRTLDVPNVIVGDEEQLHLVHTRRGPIQVATIPFPVRNRLLTHKRFRGLSVEELDKALQGIVAANIGALATKLDATIPSVLIAHQTVSGATFGSERAAMVGHDSEIPQAVVSSAAWDYVALGHIHKHQCLNDYPAVVYSGSLERVGFGEEGQPKGFCWVNLARGETTWEFVPVNARRLTTVVIDLRKVKSPRDALRIQTERQDLRGAIVRVNLRMRENQRALFSARDVRSVLREAHFISDINYDVERETRMRLAGVDPEEMTDAELLAKYFAAKGVESERVDELMRVMETIMVE